MANVTTTGNISTILSLNHSIFDDSDAILGGYFNSTFSNGVDDVLTGNVNINSFSNTRIDCYAISAGGNLILNGTGFAGYSGTISKIDFSNGSGSWTLNGSLKWNEYGITADVALKFHQLGGNSTRDDLQWDIRNSDQLGNLPNSMSKVAYGLNNIEAKAVLILKGNRHYLPEGQITSQEEMDLYKDYVAHAAVTLKDINPIFEIWNEWNTAKRKDETKGSPEAYVSLDCLRSSIDADPRNRKCPALFPARLSLSMIPRMGAKIPGALCTSSRIISLSLFAA
jgi:hypothetical protein